jgi:hypothetical protein
LTLLIVAAVYIYAGRRVALYYVGFERDAEMRARLVKLVSVATALVITLCWVAWLCHFLRIFTLPWELWPLAVVVWVIGCWRYCTEEARRRLIRRYMVSTTDPNWPPMRQPYQGIEPLTSYEGDVVEEERPAPRPLPEPPARAEWIEKNEANGTGRIHQLELPVTRKKAQALATHILTRELPFSETACCRTASIISQTEYNDMRDWMMAPERGFARWSDPDNHRQGIEVTAKGRALLRAFLPQMAYETRPALPHGDNGGSLDPQ